MRRSLILSLGLFLVFLLAAEPAHAQVCSGGITLNSQAEVDAFACSEVEGDLTIEGDDITDLSPLSGLTSVGGDFQISGNDALSSLAGLENVISVGKGLQINSNTALSSLAGLGRVDNHRSRTSVEAQSTNER